MKYQLYMLGSLLLIAGGFLLLYGYLSMIYEWEYFGGIMFFVGLFMGILGVFVPEEKTKIMLKALKRHRLNPTYLIWKNPSFKEYPEPLSFKFECIDLNPYS